jgi:trehalose/maltose hydrolase-like predicted phosphorylase
VILDWDGTAVPDRQSDASRVRARVEDLCATGVHVFVVSGAHISDVDGQLVARPAGPGHLHLCVNGGSEVFAVTGAGPALVWRRAAIVAAQAAAYARPQTASQVKHLEIGLADKADSARWAAAWLAERGITGGLVLVVGDEFGPVGGVRGSDSLMLVAELVRASVVSVGPEPGGCPPAVLHLGGGPARALELLDVQLARRRDRRVPSIDVDPAWALALPDAPAMQRAGASLGALANGWAGSHGEREEEGLAGLPLFAVNGIYTSGPMPELLAGPRWDALVIAPADRGTDHRVVDLRTGVLARHDRSGLRTLRFVSAARLAALALRAEGPAARLRGGGDIAARDGDELERRREHGAALARARAAPDGGGIAVAARDRSHVTDGRRTVERVAAWVADTSRVPEWNEALDGLAEVDRVGFDNLLAEHRQAWVQRWADADVRIEGDADAELAARFAVFHLLGAAPDQGEAAVGARGLTGRAYGGHVFWDADVFVLPALAAIRPAAARAMVEYRIRRLPPACTAAASAGYSGARFPWESAGDGTEVTPSHVQGRRGEPIPILTDDYEEHIVADVAWAACRYAAWTGDAAFLAGPGRPLLVETARYWASRIRRDLDGRAHLDGVMGPDEYHAVVDDNAYTNGMARWNLRRAADLMEATGGDAAEARTWRALADALVDGYDPERRLHEQFAGYWQLEPLLATDIAPPPVAADLLLGAQRVAGSQLIKQADVVMLHHVLPDEVEAGSLAADLAYYQPRTAHGSSLSPAIYAAQLARARQPEKALALFRLAARLDLDDITGTTAGGLHLATFGGVWQALAHGFVGLRPAGTTLEVDPCLPSAWDAVAMRFRFLGHPVGVRAERDHVTVSCTEPLAVRIAAAPVRRCEPPATTLPIETGEP